VARTPRDHPAGEHGFTLIEVLITILVVSIGLLALLSFVDRGNAATGDNLNRENATNVAREVTERAHGVAYDALATSTAATTLRNAIEAAGTRHSTTPSNGQWTMDGRTANTPVTVSVTACTVPVKSQTPIVIPATDTYCATPGGGSGTPPTTDTGTSGPCQVEGIYDPALGLRIRLLVDISLCVNGDIAKAVCALLGPTEPLNAFLEPLIGPNGAVNVLLNGLASGSIGTTLCGGKPVVVDPSLRTEVNPGRRVITTVTWTTPRGNETLTQTTIVPRPAA
jgi:type IV pilus assembly protein PilV